MKKMLFGAVAALFFLPSSLMAQDNENNDLEAHVEASIVSHYMWRGVDMAGVSLQPQLDLSWKGLSLVACGSAGFDKDDLQEIDLTLGYKNWGFNIGVTDYWQTGIEPNDLYFAYNKQTTAHRLEGNIGYTCRYGSVQAYCMFYGHDTKIDGSQAYSTYIELTVPFRLGGLDWTAKAGFTPMESAGWTVPDYATLSESLHYFYADGPTCVMASVRATKNLKLRGVTLPIFAELHTNPYMQTAHIMGGIGVKVTK
jgi:hypothetical protein